MHTAFHFRISNRTAGVASSAFGFSSKAMPAAPFSSAAMPPKPSDTGKRRRVDCAEQASRGLSISFFAAEQAPAPRWWCQASAAATQLRRKDCAGPRRRKYRGAIGGRWRVVVRRTARGEGERGPTFYGRRRATPHCRVERRNEIDARRRGKAEFPLSHSSSVLFRVGGSSTRQIRERRGLPNFSNMAGVKRKLEEVAASQPITLRIGDCFSENSSKYRLLKASGDVLAALKAGDRCVRSLARRAPPILSTKS